MKIAVVSDIHDNLERWQEATSIIKRENLRIGICCGDINSLETLRVIADSFDKLYLVFGNADYSLMDTYRSDIKNVTLFDGDGSEARTYEERWQRSIGHITLDKKKIVFAHKKNTVLSSAAANDADVIFYGHTHTPWTEDINGIQLINPGEICGRQGKPSFAIFDTKSMKAQLILLK